jgi:hypothetical protein
MKRAIVVACASACLLFASSAHAGPPDAAARESRRHFQAAEAQFKAGAFDAALAEYQAGYDAKPLPGFLINIAQCQRRLGDLKTARATYQKFVMVAPDSPLVPQAKAMVAELDKLLADLSNAPNANATVTSNGSKEGDDAQKDMPAEVDTATAPPVVTAAVPVEPSVATSAPVLVATPTPADAAPAPAGRRWWLWGTIGAVVVGGAVTAFVLSTGGTTTVHDGSLGTLRR